MIRRALALAAIPAVAASVGISGLVSAGSSTREGPGAHGSHERHGTVTGQVRALRAATDRFHDLQRAMDRGYGLLTDSAGIACIAMTDMGGMTGGMGVHFVNTDLVGDPVERVDRPEALVYRLDDRGRLRLAAVEYVVLKADWDASHSTPPQLFGRTFMLTAAGNRYGLPAFYSLHAWVWYDNPAGTFAAYNPKVTCPNP